LSIRTFQIPERKVVISESVAVLGSRKSAFAKEMLESGFAAIAVRTDPARAACPCRVVIEEVRVCLKEL
jgi:hypothetical protein